MNKTFSDRVGRRRAVLLTGIGSVVALVLIVWRPWNAVTDATTSEDLLAQSRKSLQRSEYDLAEELASRIGRDEELWGQAQLVAGEAATRAGRLEAALEYYNSVPRDGSRTAILAVFSLAEVYRHVGRLTDADREYTYVLENQPAHVLAHSRMAFLLGATGRRWESLPHYTFLLRSGNITLEELILMGDLERHMEQGDYFRKCAQNSPEDALVQLGLAVHEMGEGNLAETQRLLKEVVEQLPDLVTTHALLGEMLINEDYDTIALWHAGLPSTSDNHPETWFVRGLWARRRGKLRVAARCFWETVRLAPEHRRGNYHLGQLLVALNETSGQEFAERSSQLYELTDKLDLVLRSNGRYEKAVKDVTELMEKMGRMWEAMAWAGMASQTFPSATWPRQIAARVKPMLNENTPRTLDSENLALKYALSDFPNHQQLLKPDKNKNTHAPNMRVRSSIRFAKESSAGIDFVYYNSPDPSTKGARVFEQNGGGVAVIDYDGDEQPDLYFTQGAQWPSGAFLPTPSNRYSDRLFRNLGDSFADVTLEAGLGNQGFGQGPTVADFNNDGFSDLYVANIGRNRLYQNNGDGTFSDITDDCGLTGEEWTSSCVVVDLNADGLPDLFDANYLTGRGVYTAICKGRACSPSTFNGTPDRLHLNRGDGTFEYVPDVTPKSEAKGLGVVALDLHDRGRPSLFVANDQTPNFLLQSSAGENPSSIRLENRGFIDGLSFNEDGLPMACMGIAADDVDGDGRIDFFVTNFKDESNTLYLQDTEGLFIDATKRAGLAAPSWPFVGWGTQFLDADCDGAVDLVVTNGHVDDYRDEGGEYQMRSQFFKNTGRGRFTELFANDVGPWFEQKKLGRGLARLDWNRDGLMDFVVSQIGSPASLMTNQTTGNGHFLNIRIHATKTARDAIGTVVQVVTDERRWKKQLVAGDGYMASNQRMLQFGLGDIDSVKELQIIWPSGGTTRMKNLPVDITLKLVEGEPHCTFWRDSELISLDADVLLE